MFEIVALLICAFIVLLVLTFVGYWRSRCYARSLGTALDASGVGLVFFDARENMRIVNGEARALLHVLEGDSHLTLRRFFNVLYDKGQDVDAYFKMALHDVSGDAESISFREIIRTDNGKLCLVEARKSDGNTTTITLNDFSRYMEQQNQLDQLGRINKDLIQAVEASTCGVLLTDPKTDPHSVLFVNNACRAFWGIRAEDARDMTLGAFLKRLNLCDALEGIQGAFDAGLGFQAETRVGAGSGEDKDASWFDVRLTPVFDADGVLDLFICVFTDMTALKRSEGEFYRAQKLDALGRLSAGIAHDFNNVLSIVDGYAREISRNPDDTEGTVQRIGKVQNAAQRGADLTKRMLAFSRHKIITDTVIDLKNVIEDQVSMLCPLLDESIELRFECLVDDVFVRAGVDTISQVLINLSINARDAMPQGGVLSITLADDPDDDAFWRLRVGDTGEGIDPKTLAHIFDPFFTTKEQGRGTGLGLSVVYGLIQDIGGRIVVASQLSRGTVFSICLPKSDDAPTQLLDGDVEDVDSIVLKGYTALVVEDEEDLRTLICGELERRGMHVLCAENGDEALVVQDDHVGDIDVLVTDVVMPVLNGLKLSELMSALRPDMRVIFMSGYPARGDHARVELPEDCLFLSKPVNLDVLCQLIFASLSGQQNVILAQQWNLDEKKGDAHGAS
ncbi:MAG: hybrid sensor histidine kinase/response regulator [Alphaproteobacteria bacterium]